MPASIAHSGGRVTVPERARPRGRSARLPRSLHWPSIKVKRRTGEPVGAQLAARRDLGVSPRIARHDTRVVHHLGEMIDAIFQPRVPPRSRATSGHDIRLDMASSHRMSRGARIGAFGAAGLAIACAAGLASADGGRPASLGWVRAPGAESCIGSTALAKAVEARLGKSALVPASRAEVSIEGRIAPMEGKAGYQVALTVADDAGKILGTRSLARESADCRSLDEDVVLTVALLIDPDAALAPPPKPTSSSASVVSNVPVVTSAPVGGGLSNPGAAAGSGTVAPLAKTPPPMPSPPGDQGTTKTARTPWNAAFLAGPALSFGALPNVGVGGTIRALITPVPVFAFELGGSVWAPQTASFGGAGGDFFLATGAITACPLTGVTRGFRYAACAGVEAGLLHAGGVGFPIELQRDNPVVNGLLELRVVRPFVGPFGASLGLGLSLPFLQRQYYYLDPATSAEREVFQTSPIIGLVDLLAGFDL